MSYSITLKSTAQSEGVAGTTVAYTYTISRTDASSSQVLDWAVAAVDPSASNNRSVNEFDFHGNIMPAGSLSFRIGQYSKDITFRVRGDNIDEFNSEIFNVGILNTTTFVQGIINDDDDAPDVASESSPTLQVNSSIKTWIGGLGGSDVYRMDLQKGVSYTLTSYEIEGASTYFGHFDVTDAWGKEIVHHAYTDGSATFTPTTSGIYFVRFTSDYNHGGIEAVLTTEGVKSSAGSLTLGAADVCGLLTGFNDASVTGNSLANKIVGNVGRNSLVGGKGNDTMDGGLNRDTMNGGDGSDVYYVDHVKDVVNESNANRSTGGVDLVNSALPSYTLGSNVENGRIYTNVAANMTGNGAGNTLYAGSGDDVISGGTGTEVDTVSYAGASGAVKVSLELTTAQATLGSGTDTLVRIENLSGSKYNDTLTGSADGNVLNGGAGRDSLSGGRGADTLIGGAGQDTLSGGNGRDIFDFDKLSELGTASRTWDVISDFVRGQDRIDLSTLDANTATRTNDAFTGMLIAPGMSFTAAGQLKLEAGVLYGNTDSDAAAEFAIQLSGITALGASDFIL